MKALVSTSVCAAVLLMASCGGRMRPHYYALEIPAPPSQMASDPHISGTVAVRRFDTPAELRQGRIVYRPSPEEIGFYEYYRWAADPAEAVTTAVINSLRSTRAFSTAKRYDSRNQQDYLMVGRLERLEEIDYGGPVRVVAELSAELVNLRTGATEWTGDAAETVGVEERNVSSVVLAMNYAIQKSVDQLVVSLDQHPVTK